MDKLLKQVAFALVGAVIGSLGYWVVTNWMPNTANLVIAVCSGYLGFRLVK